MGLSLSDSDSDSRDEEKEEREEREKRMKILQEERKAKGVKYNFVSFQGETAPSQSFCSNSKLKLTQLPVKSPKTDTERKKPKDEGHLGLFVYRGQWRSFFTSVGLGLSFVLF